MPTNSKEHDLRKWLRDTATTFFRAALPAWSRGIFSKVVICLLIHMIATPLWSKIALYVLLISSPILITLSLSTHTTSRAKLWYAFTNDAINMLLLTTPLLLFGYPLGYALTLQSTLTLAFDLVYAHYQMFLHQPITTIGSPPASRPLCLPNHLPPPLIVAPGKQGNLPRCAKLNRPITLPVYIQDDHLSIYDFYTLVTLYNQGWRHPKDENEVIAKSDIKLHQETWKRIACQADQHAPFTIPPHIEEMDNNGEALQKLAATIDPSHAGEALLEHCSILREPVIKCPEPLIISDEDGNCHNYNLTDLHQWMRVSWTHPLTRKPIDPLKIQHHPCRLKRDQSLQRFSWHVPALLFCLIYCGVCLGLGLLVTLLPLHSYALSLCCFVLSCFAVTLASQYIPSLHKKCRYYFFQMIKDTSSWEMVKNLANATLKNPQKNPHRITCAIIVSGMLISIYIILSATYYIPLWAGWSSISMIHLWGLLPLIFLTAYAIKSMLAIICHTIHEYCLPSMTLENTPEHTQSLQKTSEYWLEMYRNPVEALRAIVEERYERKCYTN